MRIVLPASRVFRLAVLACGLAACAQNPPAPVEDLSHVVGAPAPATPSSRPSADGYDVQRGDSLYAIAFRNQLDWRQLAGWNGIAAPYTIYPGMHLRLTAPPGYREPVRVAEVPVFRPVESQETAAPTVVAAAATVRSPVAGVPTSPAVASPPVAAPPAATPPSATAPAASGPTRDVDGIGWIWPADGALLDGFKADDPTRQGIDVGGRTGDPVRAAADGVVVYSGNGLVGYGELVIVKHSDIYLSAYGHNRKRSVSEGERVRAGQQIAEMGSTGASRTELHFEIRRQGKPVDPMAFLPRRQGR